MAFTTEQKTVSNKLLSQVIYSIPRNQRKYVWNKKNWDDFWNDILFSVEAQSDFGPHFIGSIVLLDKGKRNSMPIYDIIDGQQRIITILLFVASIMETYKEKKNYDLVDGLKQFLWTTDTKNQINCKISTEYQPSLQDIIEVVSDKDKDLCTLDKRVSLNNDKLVKECFNFFCDKLRLFDDDKVERIKEGLLDTRYIDITATSEEDSYTIFEILNARGLILGDSELLKNFIMRYVQPRAEIDLIKKQWENDIENVLKDNVEDFLKHYVRHKYITPSSKIQPYAIIKDNNSAKSVHELFDDLRKKAKYYKKIIYPAVKDEGGECSPLEKRVFEFFKKYRSDLFRPMLLSLMSAQETGNLSITIYEKTLNYIQYFFICYNLLSHLTSNKISAGVQKYSYLIENKFDMGLIRNFIDFLYKNMPSKVDFINTFKTLGWSNKEDFYNDRRHKRQVQIALSTLELIKSNSNNYAEFTIEHILPDSLESNANIGNLLPLEANLNSNCKDKPLSLKMNSYRQSNFRLVREFVERYAKQTDKFDVSERCHHMAEDIYDKIFQLYTDFSKSRL